MSEFEKDKELEKQEEVVEVVDTKATEEVIEATEASEETKQEDVAVEEPAEPEKEEAELAESEKEEIEEEPAAKEEESVKEGEEEKSIEETEEIAMEAAEPLENAEMEDRVNELLAEIEELKAEKEENTAFKEYTDFASKVSEDLNAVAQSVQQALQSAFKDNNIPTDVTLEDLRKLDPAKATLAEQFLKDADRVMVGRKQLAEQAIKNEFTKVVFKKAERLFKKYEISDAEAPAVAETFVNIMNSVGINDLQGDLAAKVELAVARGKFITPQAKVEPVESFQEPEQPTPEVVEPPVEPEVEVQIESEIPEPEVKEPVVEIDEFTEGIAGEIGAAKPADLLEHLARIQDPRERVKFYKENEKAIIEQSKRAYYNK